MTLCAGITVPEVKADTLQAINDALDGRALAGADEQIESALLDTIAQFVPTKRNDAPGREIMRLVRWYEGKGRRAQALRALGQAKKRIGAEPQTAFRDTFAIYRFLDDIKDPGAKDWLDKAVAAAVIADAGKADYMDGGVYAGAIKSVARELARAGRIDEALAVAETLQTGVLDMNYSNALAGIVYVLADTDLPRAQALLDKMPDERQRTSCITGLAKGLATRDPHGALKSVQKTQDDALLRSLAASLAPEMAKDAPLEALKLLEAVPPAQQVSTLIRICAAVPRESPECTARCGEAVKERFIEYRLKRSSRLELFCAELETLPLRTVLALQPYFSEFEMNTYAHILCAVVARESGVGADPLWQRLDLADRPRYGQSNYWGCTYLRDAIPSWKREQGK